MKNRFVTKQFGKINISNFINNGGEGAVWLAESVNKKKKQFAIKIYNKNRIHNIKKELIIKNLLVKHNNILLPLEEVYDYKYNRKGLLYNYINGGDMHNFYDLTLNSEKKSKEYFIFNKMESLWNAINYCHEKNICHRDIKPSNILWNRVNSNNNSKNFYCYHDKLLISDFGASYINNSNISAVSPTKIYSAPENFFSGSKISYDKRCDIWTLTLTWIALLFGDNVIYSHYNNYGELLRKDGYLYLKKELPYLFNNLDLKTKNIIKSTLVPDPNDRASAKEVCDMFA